MSAILSTESNNITPIEYNTEQLTIIDRIKQLRKSKDISQIALSRKINVSKKIVSDYKKGKNEPSIATLSQLDDIEEYLSTIFQDILTSVNRLTNSSLTIR